jgi:hypothetical protein
MLLFCHGGNMSSSSPPPGELTTVVVAVALREEYHVVAAVEEHELETPEAEHRPGLKRLLDVTPQSPNSGFIIFLKKKRIKVMCLIIKICTLKIPFQ